jgi:hypothetical protein
MVIDKKILVVFAVQAARPEDLRRNFVDKNFEV